MLWTRGDLEASLSEYESLCGAMSEGGRDVEALYLTFKSNIGAILHRMGQNKQAKIVLSQTLTLQENSIGKDHLDTITTRSVFIGVLDNLGEDTERFKQNRLCKELLLPQKTKKIPKPKPEDSAIYSIMDPLPPVDELVHPTEPLAKTEHEPTIATATQSSSSVVVLNTGVGDGPNTEQGVEEVPGSPPPAKKEGSVVRHKPKR